MIIEKKDINGNKFKWILRTPTIEDAIELSNLRIQIDGETEYLDRVVGEDFLTAKDFEQLIYNDSISEKNIFLVAQVNNRIVGYSRCQGSKLSRFSHKVEFGICILKDYWGCGIGKVILENILIKVSNAGIKKISLSVVETNIRAIQLYKKFGFLIEGLLVNDRIHKDGNYYNTLIMGKILEK